MAGISKNLTNRFNRRFETQITYNAGYDFFWENKLFFQKNMDKNVKQPLTNFKNRTFAPNF